jgi:alpha-tubulin suppressor-like RCC1 family protein
MLTYFAIEMLLNVKFDSVSAGADHVVAIDTAGNVWAWGSNWRGQTGVKVTWLTHVLLYVLFFSLSFARLFDISVSSVRSAR